LFLTISGGVVYWQTPGLKGQKWLIDSIDVPFQYCFDLKDNRGAFAVYNHHIKDEHYVSVNCGVLGKDDRGRSDAPYRFHAILPWATYKELGADAFALARWAFSKEVLGRRYGNTKGEEEGELFSPQVYKNFPPELEVDRRPDMTFLKKHLADQQQLAFFLGALIAEVAPPLRFRDEEHASQWSTYDPWSERIPTKGERLLEELYLCLPYETRSWCNISTGWKQCDFKFHLALDSESSDNAAVALKLAVDALDENARSKAQAVVERYVNPLFQAIKEENVQSINQLRRAFTIKSIAWQPEKPKQHEPKKQPPVGDNNSWVALAKQPFVIGAMVVMLVIGFGTASLFSPKGDNFDKETAELERLKGELNSAEETKGSLQKQLRQAQAKIESLNGEITSLKQERATTADNTGGDKTEPDPIKTYEKNLRHQLSVCEQTKQNLVQQCQTEKDKLAQEVKNKTQEYSRLDTDYNKLNGQLSQCQTEKDNLAQEVKEKTQKYSDLDTDYNKLNGQFIQCQTEMDTNAQNLEQCQNEIDANAQNLEQCQNEIDANAQKTEKMPEPQSLSQDIKPKIAINEIAWMGTTTHYNDEWIELYNYGNSPINLEGWKLIVYKNDGEWKKWETSFSGKIGDGQFRILRMAGRHDRVSLYHWKGKTFFNGVLWNEGTQPNKVSLQLKYKEQVIDQVDQWYAGNVGTTDHYSTMERKKPKVAGNNRSNWCTASGYNYNWQAKNKLYDTGTPGTQNTCAEE
jgi:uncharacterized coiled-coil DUF342 family protein